MMFTLLFSLALAFTLVLPVNAAEVSPDESIPVVSETVPSDTEPVGQIQLGDPALYTIGGSLSGGYYFDCNCSLGNGIRFYVPVEWAQDAFAIDSSGAPVNMSSSTVYAYCPAFPEYTFSASRFNTFTYRGDGLQSTELRVTSVTESNIDFLKDTVSYPSDQEILILIFCLLFFGTTLSFFCRR